MEKTYERRIVAFIDIMGFKNHINKTERDPKYAKKLLEVMQGIVEIKNDNDKGILGLKKYGKEVSIFSDCIVISYPLSFEGGLFHILIDIVHIQIELLFSDVILRGGISIGDIYHKDQIVFGPAMVEAYYLESKIAKYPRIVLKNKTIIDGILETLPDRHTIEMESEYISSLLKVDKKDNICYLDILSQSDEFDEIEVYFEFLDKLKSIIETELKTNIDGRVVEKYKWLRKYYNKTVEECGLKKKMIHNNDYK